MLKPLLLSLLLFAGTGVPAAAQDTLCTERSREAAMSWLSRTVSYTDPVWQSTLDSFLRHCPDWAYAWQMKAMPYIKKGRYSDAFSNLKRAIALEPDLIGYQAYLKCIFAKDYRGALADLDTAAIVCKGGGVMDHSFVFFKSLCYLCLQDYPRSIELMREDIARQTPHLGKGKEHYNSWLYLGIGYYLSGRYPEALQAFQVCLKQYPNFADANYYKGMVLRKQGNTQAAKVLFEKAQLCLEAGFTLNEDNQIYVNYPYQISFNDINNALKLPL